MDVLALITARGGSKGLPRKNVLPLAGKPVIAWTISAALQSPSLSRVVVSTDDEEIAQVSRDWGAEVPFMRSSELAQDDSPHMSVIIHAIRWLEAHQEVRPEYVMLLQPTSPLRTAEDIEAATQLAHEKLADSVVSVCLTHHHPYLTKKIAKDGTMADFMSNTESDLRRQVLPPAYILNGAIYLARREVLLNEQTFHPARTFPYVMPPERSLQIDDPWDLHLVNLILENQHGSPTD
ncbi:MAG: acylneuraminate cytidylyltransferase family protein [SAR202 cluster bacterium]|nr:acylneuraminate cytidylyltransferase family protein [SAR202 cluster bacterium]